MALLARPNTNAKNQPLDPGSFTVPSQALSKAAQAALDQNTTHEAKILALLQQIADQSTDLQFFCWPPSDGLQPIATGDTVIDFKNNTVQSPAGALETPKLPDGLYKSLRSIYVNVDTVAFIHIFPGNTVVKMFPSSTYYSPLGSGGIERLTISTRSSANVYCVVSTSPTPSNEQLTSQHMYRWSDVTVTKVSAASTADPLLTSNIATVYPTGSTASPFFDKYNDDALGGQIVPFVARTTPKTLLGGASLALAQKSLQNFPDSQLLCHGLSQKLFIVRNVGANSVDVQAFGTFLHTVQEEIVAVTGSASQAMIPDTDINGGTPLTIPAGQNAILESGIPWFGMFLRARCSASVAAGSNSRLFVEAMALGPQSR